MEHCTLRLLGSMQRIKKNIISCRNLPRLASKMAYDEQNPGGERSKDLKTLERGLIFRKFQLRTTYIIGA